MNKRNVKWHRLSADAAVKQLHTNASCGLSRKEARSRYRRYGENTLFSEKKRHSASVLKALLCDPALLLLLFVCLLACFFSELAAGLCTLICFLCGMALALRLAYIEKRMHADIARYRIPRVSVIRDGGEYLISARHVVPGDVILLRRGDTVPADCRLLFCRDLKVLTLCPNQEGHRATWLALPKNAERVYPYGDPILSPNQENMLFGGSEITQGFARAVVTETGAYTFLGAMETFLIPNEFHAEAQIHAHNSVRTYLKLYAFLLFLLLIPLTVVGMLTVPEDLGILRVFLSISALCGSGAQAFLILHFQGAAISIRSKGLGLLPHENRFAVKSSGSSEKLASLTDIFVRGHCGISDGVLHLHGITAGNGEIATSDMKSNSVVQSLCEAYLLLHEANSTSKNTLQEEDTYASLRRELLSASGFDRVAMQVRLIGVDLHTAPSDKETLLHVRMKGGEFDLLFTEDLSCVKQCLFYEEHDGGIRVLTSAQRDEIFRFSSLAKEQGSCLQAVLRNQNGQVSLIGVVALQEQLQSVLPSVIEELSQCGVRVTFLLQSCEYDRRMAAAARLLGEAVSADACTADSLKMIDFIEKYRVFYGFSEREIGDCIRTLRKNGRKVAFLGTHMEDLPLLRISDLAVSCDTMCRADGKARIPEGGRHITEDDRGGSSAILRHADLLIHRAKRLGGGLSSLLRLISDCRAVQYKLPVIFRFLLSSQFFRLLLTAISVCFGKGIMSGAQILYSGMLCETVGVLWILSLFVPQNRLRIPQTFSDAQIFGILRDRRLWFPPLIAGIVTGGYAVILCYCNVITEACATPYLFASLLLLQLAVLFLEVRRSGLIFNFKQTVIPILTVWVPALILIAFSVAFPTFHQITELGEWHLISLLSLPLAPLFYLLFSRFFYRTAK